MTYFNTKHLPPVLIIITTIITLILLLPGISKPQTPDSPNQSINNKQSTITNQEHSPQKATIMSAVLPGLGQAYNKKYWKIPVIYAGFAGLVYSISFFNGKYQNYKQAYIWRTDTLESTIDKYDPQLANDEIKLSEDGLFQYKESYRKNRDLSYILTGVLYILNIIDANVDAHFFDYDISEDLTLIVNPYICNPVFCEEVKTGFRLTLKL
ncbi:MAG: DUF5683 domain-containing protein [Bacteroidota bacterium]